MAEQYQDESFIYEKKEDGKWYAVAAIAPNDDRTVMYPGERITFDQFACLLCDEVGGYLVQIYEDVSSETIARSEHPYGGARRPGT